MTPLERDVLTIVRGDETIYDEEGIYDIRIYLKDDGAVASIQDAVTEETLYKDVTLEYVVVKAPFIHIQLPEKGE